MFWIREIMGWLLVVGGLFIFVLCLSFVGNRQLIEAGILAGFGVFIFRGGIHLIKVATAARVVLASRRQMESTGQGRPTSD